MALQPAAAAAQGDDGYVVRDLAPGVFTAVAPDGVPSYLFANSLVVMGDDGVLVVDSGDRPELAHALIALIRERTERPVRWLVNTHWHGDHVRGNAVFREAFPQVRILSTPTTRDSIATGGPRQVAENVARQRDARARLAAMMDTADTALRARIRVADSVRRRETTPGTETATAAGSPTWTRYTDSSAADIVSLPGGHCDGIEMIDDDVLIASQDDTSLHLVGHGGVRRVNITRGRPADLGIDTHRGRVAVPYVALGRVDIWPLAP